VIVKPVTTKNVNIHLFLRERKSELKNIVRLAKETDVPFKTLLLKYWNRNPESNLG